MKYGIMTAAGEQQEKDCAKDVAAYFRVIGGHIRLAHLEQLMKAASKETARHAAEMKVGNIVRRKSDLLQDILESNLYAAMEIANKQTVVKEAAPITVGPISGMLSEDAAEYAEKEAAKQVTGINKVTVEKIADLVSLAVENQMTPSDLSRDLRDLIDGMTKDRADLIARTEMSDAFGEAAMKRLKRNEIDYKQLILSPDACPICISIEDNGPVPINDPFVDDDGEEYDRSPIHPNCRCATVGANARVPEGE